MTNAARGGSMTDDDFADAVEADNSPVAKLLAAKDAEIERLRAARDAAVADMEAPAQAEVRRAVAAERERCAKLCLEKPGYFGSFANAELFAALIRDAAPEVPR